MRCIVLTLLLSLTCLAEDAATTHSWWEMPWAGGDWGGVRKKWEDKGYVFEFTYTGEERANFRGGLSTNDAQKFLANVNASFDLFTEKAGFYPGGEFYVRFENVHGEGISEHFTGDTQLLSSIDAHPFNQVSECFYRQSFLNDRLYFKIGKQDGTGDFISLKYASEFNHSVYGCPSNLPIPRFHNDALGIVAGGNPLQWLWLGAGTYDDRSTGKTTGFDTAFGKSFHGFSIAEIRIDTGKLASLPGSIHIGAWHERRDLQDSSSLTATDHSDYHHNAGAYADFEALVLSQSDIHKSSDAATDGNASEDDHGLALFAQVSWSLPDRSEAPWYFGGGMRYKGMIAERHDDSFGVGIISTKYGEKLRRADHRTAESGVEAFYKLQITPFFYVQPDFQYIVKPGGKEPNATTAGVRFKIAF